MLSFSAPNSYPDSEHFKILVSRKILKRGDQGGVTSDLFSLVLVPFSDCINVFSFVLVPFSDCVMEINCRKERGWVYDRKQRAQLTQWSQGWSDGQVSSDPIISFLPWFPSSAVGIIIFALLPCGVAVHAMFKQDNHTKQYNNNHSQDKAELVCDSEKNHSQWLWSQ